MRKCEPGRTMVRIELGRRPIDGSSKAITSFVEFEDCGPFSSRNCPTIERSKIGKKTNIFATIIRIIPISLINHRLNLKEWNKVEERKLWKDWKREWWSCNNWTYPEPPIFSHSSPRSPRFKSRNRVPVQRWNSSIAKNVSIRNIVEIDRPKIFLFPPRPISVIGLNEPYPAASIVSFGFPRNRHVEASKPSQFSLLSKNRDINWNEQPRFNLGV